MYLSDLKKTLSEMNSCYGLTLGDRKMSRIFHMLSFLYVSVAQEAIGSEYDVYILSCLIVWTCFTMFYRTLYLKFDSWKVYG